MRNEWFWKMIEEVHLEDAIASVADWSKIRRILTSSQLNYGGEKEWQYVQYATQKLITWK